MTINLESSIYLSGCLCALLIVSGVVIYRKKISKQPVPDIKKYPGAYLVVVAFSWGTVLLNLIALFLYLKKKYAKK